MSRIRAIPLRTVSPKPLAQGSWSRMVITRDQVDGNLSCLGVSLFTPATESTPLRHDVEELAYVTRGRGELRTDEEVLAFQHRRGTG